MNTCPLCVEPLTGVLRSKPGRAPILRVRCGNSNCPMRGRRLMTPPKYQIVCEATRRDIVLNWEFNRCLAKPCPVTLTAALMLMVEVSPVARFETMRAGYHLFVNVCWLPDLLAAAEALMQKLVPINGQVTSSCPVNGGQAVTP